MLSNIVEYNPIINFFPFQFEIRNLERKGSYCVNEIGQLDKINFEADITESYLYNPRSESRCMINHEEQSADKRMEVRSVTISKSIKLFNQVFDFLNEDGVITLTHPKWSLVGIGDDLLSAERNLVENAKILADGYFQLPINELTLEAIEFRNYLLTLF